jgi:hypothetical protein
MWMTQAPGDGVRIPHRQLIPALVYQAITD